MSNYAITARYQPFSFQERIAPLLMLRDEYDAVEQGLATMGEEANTWQQYIDPESRSGQKLAAYNQLLSDTANNLSREGLKAVSRNTLFGLRRTYHQDISKINRAAQTLAGMYDQYKNMYAKDQTMMMGSMPTVDELVDNPAASPTFVSGTQLYAQANAAAKAAAARNVQTSAALDGVLKGYFRIIKETGYNSEETQAFLENYANIPELQEAMQQIRESYGTDRLNNPAAADTWILRGILDGMGYQKTEDFKYDQYGAEQRAFARQKELAALQAQSQFLANNPVRTRAIYTNKERSEEARYFDQVSKYFQLGQDGQYHLTKEGKEQFKRAEIDKQASQTPFTQTYKAGKADSFLSRTGVSGNDTAAVENAFNNYVRQISGELPDATRATEYVYDIDPSDKNVWMGKLMSTATDGKVSTVQWDNKNKRFIPDDKVKIADIQKGIPVSFNASPYGSTLSVNIPGKGIETFMFQGYSSGVDDLIGEELNNIQIGERNIDKFLREELGVDPTKVGNPKNLLQQLQLAAAQGSNEAGYYAQRLQNKLLEYEFAQHSLMAAMSQYGHTNTTKHTEYEGFDW